MYSRLDTSGFGVNNRGRILRSAADAPSAPEKVDTTKVPTFYGIPLRGFCLYTGLIHILGAISVAITTNTRNDTTSRLQTPITNMLSIWTQPPAQATPTSINSGSVLVNTQACPVAGHNVSYSKYITQHIVLDYGPLPSEYIMMGAFLVSGLAQFVVSFHESSYYDRLKRGKNHYYKYMELSLSGPLLVLVVCSQLGVTNMVLLFNVVGSTWASFVFFLISEIILDDQSPGYLKWDICADVKFRYYGIAQFAGDVMLVFSLLVVISNATLYKLCINANPKDNFQVYGQVMAGVISGSFLIVALSQIASLFLKEDGADAEADQNKKDVNVNLSVTIEFIYILINFLTKGGICILLYSSNLLI
jgi:hypothetical protein